jgi:MerR family transcriptional regulator, copper efflux regulator
MLLKCLGPLPPGFHRTTGSIEDRTVYLGEYPEHPSASPSYPVSDLIVDHKSFAPPLEGCPSGPQLLTVNVSKGSTVNMTELLGVIRDERVTARFVRFLIAEGVIPAPRGGRAKAEYGDDHVQGIRRYLHLRDLGLSASRTKEIVAGAASDGIPIPIAPGLTVIVDQEKIGKPPDPKQIAAKIAEAIQLVKPKGS